MTAEARLLRWIPAHGFWCTIAARDRIGLRSVGLRGLVEGFHVWRELPKSAGHKKGSCMLSKVAADSRYASCGKLRFGDRTNILYRLEEKIDSSSMDRKRMMKVLKKE